MKLTSDQTMALFGTSPTPDDLMDLAGRLGAIVRGDFDDGAYGRYDEPVFIGWMAYFHNTWRDKTPFGRGATPYEAIAHLFFNVKDRQRVKGEMQKILFPPAARTPKETTPNDA